MRFIIQRVKKAQVRVENKIVGSINHGYAVFVGFGLYDNVEKIHKSVDKLITLRIMPDEKNKMNKDIVDAKGSILVIPQFTLYADISGRRPNFNSVLKFQNAKKLFDTLISQLRKKGISVQQGIFGSLMEVDLVNDGPVTILYEN